MGGHTPPILAGISEHYELVVVSGELPASMRGQVRWERLPLGKSRWTRWALAFGAAPRALRRAGADLVHEQSSLPLARRVDLATVLFSWTALYEAIGDGAESPRGALSGAAAAAWSRLERWSYSPRRASMLAALCPSHRDELERLFPGVPVGVTPRGTDPLRFRPDRADRRRVRAALGIAEDDVVVAFMARAEPYKGLPLVIDALAELRQRGRPAPLLLAITPDAPWARWRAEQRGVADRVIWPGWEVEVAEYLRAADLFALPSAYETYCQAAHEAAATGLPVIGTAVSGIRELIGNDEAGLLVERSAPAVAEAILRLQDPTIRARLGAEGRRRCERETIDGFVEATLELYERLLVARSS